MKKRIINAFALAFGFSVFGWIMFLLGHYHGEHTVLAEVEKECDKIKNKYDWEEILKV